MPDTADARAAIHRAYERHREVMGGMSTAELKLQAAAGQFVGDDPPPQWPLDSPVWIEHATDGLDAAVSAAILLLDALQHAQAEVAKLGEERP